MSRGTPLSRDRDQHEPDGAAGDRPFEQLLQSDPELLRSLVDQAADCVCLHEIDGRILDVNQRMCATLGYARDELLELTVFDIDVTATTEEAASIAILLTPGAPVTMERVLRRKDGSTLPIELKLSLITSGSRQLLLGMARDITDRKRVEQAQEEAQRALEERVHERTAHLEITNRRLEEEIHARQAYEAARQLLLHELDHRVKNTLSTVQAVAELTMRTSRTLGDFADTFRGRIAALARMHAAIWRNKGTPLRLRELAELSLAPFGSKGERASIDGDDVSIPLQAAGAIGLVLHELATNAVKHGALSVISGRVDLAWRTDGERLSLTWRESGGPVVTEPSHRGFGSVLIEQSIPFELGGSVVLNFAAGGVECSIVLPLAAMIPGSARDDG
jgi:PAS domain S-box-containing protein